MELTDGFVLAVGLLSLLTNGMLLVILLKDPLRCFKNRSTTYFIISLSLSDLLTGANACFWAINKLTLLPENFRRYLLSLFWITTQVSFLTLLAMSVERFVIVKYPLYCRMWITKKRVSLFIALIWLVSAILGGLVLLPAPQVLYVQFSIFTEFFVSVFVIAGLYAFILLGIKHSQKSIKGTGRLHQGRGYKMQELQLTRTPSSRKDACRVNGTSEEEPRVEPENVAETMFGNCPETPRIISPRRTEDGGQLTDDDPCLGRGSKSRECLFAKNAARIKDTSRKNATASEEPNRLQGGKDGTIFDECPGTPRIIVPRGTQNGGDNIGRDRNAGDVSPVENHPWGAVNGKDGVEGSGPLLKGEKPQGRFLRARQAVLLTQSMIKSREKSRTQQQENKLTAVVLLLVGVLALTVLPYLLASQISAGYAIFCHCAAPEVLVKFTIFYFPIELLNFAVNPLIYAWRLPQYRRTLRYMCTRYQPASPDSTSVWERDALSFRTASVRVRKIV